MSSDYSVFVENKTSTSKVRNGLEEIVNHPLRLVASEAEEIYSVEFLGLGISLFAGVSYEDDNIEFSKYDHQIMIDYKGLFDKGYSDQFRSIVSIIIASMLSTRLRCECIAVENVHSIIQTFIPQEKGA
jgi:hypothetical protein